MGVCRELGTTRDTEPSYSNERYDTVSRKPLDGFQNTIDTKYVFRFEKGFVTTILLNSTI